MGVTAEFYAIHWTSWRREHPGQMPDIDWLLEQAILSDDLDVTPTHRSWLASISTRRGHNKRWYDHLDAESAYDRCRAHLSPDHRARLDPLVDALICPHDGERQPIAFSELHLLYPPELVSEILALETDLSPIAPAMEQVELSDLARCPAADVFEQVLWEWLDVFEQVHRRGADWGLLVGGSV